MPQINRLSQLTKKTEKLNGNAETVQQSKFVNLKFYLQASEQKLAHKNQSHESNNKMYLYN